MPATMTPMKAIRAKCLDCSCGSATEVRLCPRTICGLYQYRFGKRPTTNTRQATPAQLAALDKARIARARIKLDKTDLNGQSGGTT